MTRRPGSAARRRCGPRRARSRDVRRVSPPPAVTRRTARVRGAVLPGSTTRILLDGDRTRITPGPRAGKILLKLRFNGNSCGVLLDLREVLSLSSHETATSLKSRGGPVTDLITPELAPSSQPGGCPSTSLPPPGRPPPPHPAPPQPYAYHRAELVEPDWTRLPGWKDVT